MCFNKESSLILFLFGTCGFIKFVLDGTKDQDINKILIGVFIFLLAGMQIVEYILWLAVERNWKQLNIIGSHLVGVTLFLQPVLTYVITNALDAVPEKYSDLNIAGWVILALFVLLHMYHFYSFMNLKTRIVKPDNLSCRLSWPFTNSVSLWVSFFYFVFYSLPVMFAFIYVRFWIGFYLFIAAVVVSILYSKVFYENPARSGIFGTFWCFFLAFVTIVYVIFSDYLDDIHE